MVIMLNALAEEHFKITIKTTLQNNITFGPKFSVLRQASNKVLPKVKSIK